MNIWPTNFPCPQIEGWGEVVDTAITRTAEGVLPAEYGRLNQRLVTSINVTWVVPQSQLSDFQNWLCDYGYGWFQVPMPGWHEGVEDIIIRLTADLELEFFLSRSGPYWKVRTVAEYEPIIPQADPFWNSVLLLLRNESATGFVDSSKYQWPVLVSNTPVIDPAIGQWGAGSLNADSGYGRIADDPLFVFSGNGVTLEVAYYRDSGSTDEHHAFAFGYGTGSEAILGVQIPTFNAIRFSGPGSGVVGGAGSIGTWNRLVMQWWNDGVDNRGAIYHNGERILNAIGQSQPNALTSPYIWVGRSITGTGFPWKGRLGEIRLTDAKRYTEYLDGATWRIDQPNSRMLGG